MAARILSAALLLAATALGRTDIEGCTYYDSVVDPGYYAPYATRIWYVPDTGELCELLECGGGRAPPKTTLPGCPQYAGTATYSPRYIDVKTLGGSAPATKTTVAAAASSAESSAEESDSVITEAPASSTAVEEETSSASAEPDVSETQSGAGPEMTTSVKSQSSSSSSSSNNNNSDAASSTPAPSSTSSSDVSTGAAAPTGVVLGSWAVAGVAFWAGMM